MAFELLSLFPDGIGLETFKRLTNGHRNTKNNSNVELQQTMITDKIIKALENKSIIENNNGLIKLQSIVGKFAEGQLRCRNNLTRFYRNAFEYNRMFTSALIELKNNNEKRTLEIFNSQQANFLKSITYFDMAEVDSADLIDYLEELGLFFINICSPSGLIRELSIKVDSFHGRDRQCVETQLLLARYFDGDFDNAFAEIKKVTPLETLATLDRSNPVEHILAGAALNIYLMEGEALYSAKYEAKHKLIDIKYPASFFALGEYNKELVECCKYDFATCEVLANIGSMSALEVIDAYLSGLYDKAHLERMQVSYTRSKLIPIKQQDIEILVTVNPYTRGLKGLMLAFVEQDATKAEILYLEAISQLSHIRYYHVEALYYYTKFLQKHAHADFASFYGRGLGLAQKHQYRFLQYQFEQLLNHTDTAYDPCNYPFPDNYNLTGYIQFLIKENKKRKGK
ncbi:MAG: hypothetical protein PHF56_09775 [Desulfuromonadaceae bacterium]|nr:hypothetical protein [Desulfuromonadaceae bacterium]